MAIDPYVAAAAAEMPEHDHAVADLGIILIIVAGLISGQFIRIGKVAWGGFVDPNVQKDILILAGEFAYVLILALISEQNNDARSFSLALLWGSAAVLLIVNSQVISDQIAAYQKKTVSAGSSDPGIVPGTIPTPTNTKA